MVTEVKPEHWEKQPSPKLVTELGMVTEVKPEQPSKQLPPKLVTELGMVMEVKPEQSEYLLMIDVQWFVLNTVEKWRYRFYLGSEAEDLTCLTFVYIKMNSTI